MLEKILADYLAFLLEQTKQDAGWISTWWMWALFLVPITGYLFFALVKWYFLLLPLTLPLTVWGVYRTPVIHHHYHNDPAPAGPVRGVTVNTVKTANN